VLDEVFRLGDQDLLDQVGPIEQEDRAAEQAEGNHVAVLAAAASEEGEPVGAELGEAAREEAAGGAARRGHGATLRTSAGEVKQTRGMRRTARTGTAGRLRSA